MSKVTFQPIPRNGRKVLCDDNGEDLMEVTFAPTTIIGTQKFPAVKSVQSFTQARKTWKKWTADGYDCQLLPPS